MPVFFFFFFPLHLKTQGKSYLVYKASPMESTWVFSSTFRKKKLIYAKDSQAHHQEYSLPLGSFRHEALKRQTLDLRLLTQGFIPMLLPNHELNKYLSGAYSVQSSVPV